MPLLWLILYVLSCALVQDMQKSGAPLAEILKSLLNKSTVVKYIDECELEMDVALEAAVLSDLESDGET